MADLTVEQLKSVYNNEGALGRLELAKYLGWKNIEKDENLKKAIELDFVYDTLLFCGQKGCPWKQSWHLVNISVELLSECTGKPLVQVIQHLTDLCRHYQSEVDENYMCSYTEYMFTTFLQHYQLYQTVLTEERSNMFLHHDLLVETAPCPLPFSEAKNVKIWEYEEALNVIDKRGQEKKKELEAQQVAAKLTGDLQRKECYNKFEEVEGALSREQLEALIGELAAAHLSSLSINLGHEIKTTMTDLTTTLQKNSLPRPQELDPVTDPCSTPPDSRAESELVDDFPAELAARGARLPRGSLRAGSRAGPSSSSMGLRKSAASRAGSRLAKSHGATARESSPGKVRVRTAQVKDKPAVLGKSARGSSRGSRAGSRAK